MPFGQRVFELDGRDVCERLGRPPLAAGCSADGIQGAKRRGKPWRTTTPDPDAHRRPDLVQRDFTATAPNRLWVDPAAARHRPRPGAPPCATSRDESRDQPRRDAPAARTRSPAAHRDRSTPGGTSVLVASLEGLLSRGQIVLDSKSPRNPAWLINPKRLMLGYLPGAHTSSVVNGLVIVYSG